MVSDDATACHIGSVAVTMGLLKGIGVRVRVRVPAVTMGHLKCIGMQQLLQNLA